jgi:Protein of unknown function (DUF3732)
LTAIDIPTADLADNDRASVTAMFELMRDLVNESAPELQVIVMDDANLAADWFQDAVVEVWRSERRSSWRRTGSRTSEPET